MGISEKDQKILWSRAAGRCSMPDCRVVLTLDAENGASKTLGAMAHIVADSPDFCRGKSDLTPQQRDAYANRILLCQHHHDVIDTDCERWPIEVLHQVKVEHELWVAESLAAQSPIDADQLVYSTLIDSITEGLQLGRWTSFVDNAVRDIVHEDLVEARTALGTQLFATIWPQTNRALEQAITNVVSAFERYIDHFMEGSEYRGAYYARDRSYARYINPNYHEFAERQERWSEENFWLLADYVIKVNAFAEAVRGNSNPLYFLTYGRFLVIDSLGVWSDGKPRVWYPHEDEVGERLHALGLIQEDNHPHED